MPSHALPASVRAFILLGVASVAAKSSGPTVCDAINVCNYPGGVCPPGMDLVAPPERSSVYQLETDVTSYTPGEPRRSATRRSSERSVASMRYA